MMGWYDGQGFSSVLTLVFITLVAAGALVSLLLVLVRSSQGDLRHERLAHPAPHPVHAIPVGDLVEGDEGQFVHRAAAPMPLPPR